VTTALSIDAVKKLIQAKRWDELLAALKALHFSDIADLIIQLPSDLEGIVFRILPRKEAGRVFSYLPAEHQESLLRSVSNEEIRSIVEEMTPDDRTSLLHELPAEVTRRLLESLSPQEVIAA